jgi:hypothetical protein
VRVDQGGGLQPLGLAPFQGGEGVGGFAGLRDGQGERRFGDGWIAVAELRRDLHVHGQTRQTFEQIFARQPGVVGRTAGHDLQPLDASEIERPRRPRLQRDGVEVGGEGVLACVRLLMDLLLHEVAILALFDQRRG